MSAFDRPGADGRAAKVFPPLAAPFRTRGYRTPCPGGGMRRRFAIPPARREGCGPPPGAFRRGLLAGRLPRKRPGDNRLPGIVSRMGRGGRKRIVNWSKVGVRKGKKLDFVVLKP